MSYYLEIPEITSSKFNLEHLEDLSSYNHNFYKIVEPVNYMAILSFIECDIVYEVCDEDYNDYTYTFGMFNKDGEFIECFLLDTGSCYIKEKE